MTDTDKSLKSKSKAGHNHRHMNEQKKEMPQAKETESHRIYFHLSYIPSTIPIHHGGSAQGGLLKPGDFSNTLKESVKKSFLFHRIAT